MSKLQSFRELIIQIQALESSLKGELEQLILNIAKSQIREKISKHIFIIKYSEISGNPWNPEFYDWECAGDELLRKIRDKRLEEALSYIETLYETRKGDRCDIVYKKYYRGCNIYDTVKIPIPSAFVKEVLDTIGTTFL